MVASMGTLGALRAASNWWILPRGPSWRTQLGMLLLTPSGDESCRKFSNEHPLILTTTLSASLGYFSKYLLSSVRELRSGVPYSSPPTQKLQPASIPAHMT